MRTSQSTNSGHVLETITVARENCSPFYWKAYRCGAIASASSKNIMLGAARRAFWNVARNKASPSPTYFEYRSAQLQERQSYSGNEQEIKQKKKNHHVEMLDDLFLAICKA